MRWYLYSTLLQDNLFGCLIHLFVTILKCILDYFRGALIPNHPAPTLVYPPSWIWMSISPSRFVNLLSVTHPGAGKEVDLDLVMVADDPTHIEETLFCDLKHSSAPVYVYVKADFKVSTQERM